MKYKITILLFIHCFCQVILAQTIQKVDSMELLLNYADKPTNKIDNLLNLSRALQGENPTKALYYAQKAYKISVGKDNEKEMLNSLIVISYTYWNLNDFKPAMENAIKAKLLAEKLNLHEKQVQSLRIIGLIYLNIGNYSKSSEIFLKCLKLSEQINNKEEIGNSLSNIATIYFEQKNYEKALKYFFTSLNLSKEIKKPENIAKGYNNIAAVYSYNEKPDYIKSCKYFKLALEINKKLGNKKSEGINYLNLGDITQKQKNYEEALLYYKKALSIFISIKDTLFIARLYVNLGNYYYEINNNEKGLICATMAYEEGKKQKLNTVMHISSSLICKIYLKLKDTISAFKYSVIENQIKDSLNVEKSRADLSKLMLLYEFDKTEQMGKNEQQHKNLVYTIIIISLIFSIIIVVIILNVHHKIKNKNSLLYKKQLEDEIEFKNKELIVNVMSQLKQKEMMTMISGQLTQLKDQTINDAVKKDLDNIALKIKICSDSEIWKEFELRFKNVHVNYYSKLLEFYPDLSPNELRICALLRLNMTSKEISSLTGQSINAIEMVRFRIRKKLGISSTNINLVTFLSKV